MFRHRELRKRCFTLRLTLTWITSTLSHIVSGGTIKGDAVGVFALDNDRWRIADQTAAFLSVDRDVCRMALYEEPLGLVSEVVESVLTWKDDPDYDPERMIMDWARDVGAGVFDETRRNKSDLTHIGEIVSGEFLRLAFERPELDPEYDYHLYLICVRLEEKRLGRKLTPSQLDQFTRRFNAPSYRRDLAKIPKEQWDDLYLELEDEEPRIRQKRPPRQKVS
jgi:hypothetical protein